MYMSVSWSGSSCFAHTTHLLVDGNVQPPTQTLKVKCMVGIFWPCVQNLSNSYTLLYFTIVLKCITKSHLNSIQYRGERYPRFLIEWIYCWIESCQFQHFESNFELNFFEFNNVLNWILSKIFLLNILLNWILSQNFLLNFLLNWIGLKNWKSVVFWIDIVILYPKIP